MGIKNIYGWQINDFVKGFVNLKGIVDLYPVIDKYCKISVIEHTENSKAFFKHELYFEKLEGVYTMDSRLFKKSKEFSEVIKQLRELDIDNCLNYDYEKYEILINGVKTHFVSKVDFTKDKDGMERIGKNLINILLNFKNEDDEQEFDLTKDFERDFENDFSDGRI